MINCRSNMNTSVYTVQNVCIGELANPAVEFVVCELYSACSRYKVVYILRNSRHAGTTRCAAYHRKSGP